MPCDWRCIDRVREGIALLLGVRPHAAELAGPLAMVCAELLENAVKYGVRDAAPVLITVREEPARVVIDVTNDVAPGSRHLAALRARLGWIAGFAQPGDAYLAAVEAVYEGDDAFAGEGGLGLVRVAHEGGCLIECDDSTAGRVTVRAVRPRAAAERA